GGWPPFGEASVRSTPPSRKTKYGAANSSSQKPVLRPVSPSRSCDVSTIRIFMVASVCRDWTRAHGGVLAIYGSSTRRAQVRGAERAYSDRNDDALRRPPHSRRSGTSERARD